MITKKLLLIPIILIITIFFLERKIILIEKRYQGKIYPNIFADNINLSNKTKNEVDQIYYQLNKKLQAEKIIIYLKNQPVATFSGKQFNLHFDSNYLFKKSYNIGREKDLRKKFFHLTQLFIFRNPIYIKNTVSYNKSIINDFIHQQEDIYNKPAKNALFKFKNNRVVAFKKEENGEEILTKEFLENFDRILLQNRSPKKIITIKTKIIKPEITLASTNNFGIEEMIGFGKSDFSGSITERVHNIILAASKLNGILIAPNKVFSFNETVGDISSLTGYKPAYIIKDGKTILGDGGGVCQVSTTLFRAALNAGLPIIERHPHAYRVHYYENDSKPGLDATVFSPYIDLKIKNDTPAYILIQTEVDQKNNLLFFYIYGKKDQRKVILSPIIVWDVIPPPEPKYQDDPTLKKGTIKQIEWAAWGAKSSFTYKVSQKGKIIFEKTFFSSYRPWPAVFLVGTAD
jgi:vancomycin resistance protein YoaR